MIILDTCVIRAMRLNGSDVEVLKAIVATQTERVGAPWMAMEELAAQKALDYLDAHRAAARALRQLQHKSHRAEPTLDDPDAEAVREKWRGQYAGFLEVLPTSESALRQGVYREANTLPPAATKGDGEKRVKVGARDVAIWLTAVEYARDHPDETVYFVSSNTRDFTKGDAGYPSPMDTDVADLGDRFVHLTNLGEILEVVAPRVGVDEADVRGLLEQQTGYITEAAFSTWSGYNTTPFPITAEGGELDSARGWVFNRDVKVQLLDVCDIAAYRLGSDSWYVATARWQFAGLALCISHLRLGACTWETRILAPARSGDAHVPRIIKDTGPRPAADVSGIEWPPFPRSWEFTQHTLRLAEEEGRKPTLTELMLSMVMGLPAVQRRAKQDLDTGKQVRAREAVGLNAVLRRLRTEGDA